MNDINNSPNNEEPDINTGSDIHRINRRRMAWISLIAILVVTLLSLFIVDTDRLDKLEEIITWFYISMASVVGAYVGFSTIWDKTKKK